MLNALKTVCLENNEEKLYIANSQQISKLILQLFMSDFYPIVHTDRDLQAKYFDTLKLPEEKKTQERIAQFDHVIEVQKIIKKYKNKDKINLQEEDDQQCKITA